MIEALKTAEAQAWWLPPWWTEMAWPVAWALLGIVAIVRSLDAGAWPTSPCGSASCWAACRMRPGPNRVGPLGLAAAHGRWLEALDQRADHAHGCAAKGLFYVGPVMAIMPALAAWAVVPFAPDVALANVNAGILLVMAITSIEVYWRDHCRLGFKLQVRVFGCLAGFGTNGQLRNCHGFLLPDRHHGDGQHELDGHRAQPGQGQLC